MSALPTEAFHARVHPLTRYFDSIGAMAFQDAMDPMPGSSPVLVLLDLNLPKMDGREFSSQIKEDTSKTIPFILTLRMTAIYH